jgi:hypothetical protein
MMQLTDIAGSEEWICEEGVYGGHTLSWTDVNRERRQAVEKDPYVLIGSFLSLVFPLYFKSLSSRWWTHRPQRGSTVQAYEHPFTAGRIQLAYR